MAGWKEINPRHLEKFRTCVGHKIDWVPYVPSLWVESHLSGLVEDRVVEELPRRSLDMSEVRDFCRDQSNSDASCYLVIMAWGKQIRRNPKLAWAERSKWEPLVNYCRTQIGPIERSALFDTFNDSKIAGLAPAFFTKLMFFLRPKSENCFILDQWTGRSANLLTSANKTGGVVYLDRSLTVARKNTGKQYLDYCFLVERLSEEISGCSPHDIEQAMFSGGKDNPWRQYLMEHKDATPTKIL